MSVYYSHTTAMNVNHIPTPVPRSHRLPFPGGPDFEETRERFSCMGSTLPDDTNTQPFSGGEASEINMTIETKEEIMIWPQ